MSTEGRPFSELDIGVNQGTTNALGGMQRRLSMRVAKVAGVHPETNTVDLTWLWPVRGGLTNVDISRPYVGFRSGIHFVPEVGSVVVIGYAFNQIIMLSYLLPSEYSKMLNGYTDQNDNPARIRQMLPGEISLNSIQNSEIYLHDSVEMRDSNGDTITIDPSDSSINLSSLSFYLDNEAGEMIMGPVIRNSAVVTQNGVPVSLGGNSLTELSLIIEKYSDGTIFDGTQNENLVSATVGTLVDDNGSQVVDQANNNIILNADFYTTSISTPLVNNANLKVDDAGNFNINDGNMLLPTAIPAIPVPFPGIPNVPGQLLTTPTGTVFVGQSQQRAAREGDRIVIPMSTPVASLQAHPDLAAKFAYNLIQMQQIVAGIMTPMGPCLGYIPTSIDARLVGMITQGSDSVFVGSLNKTAETIETNNNSL